MPDKPSRHELKRLVELAVADVCGLPRPGLWFCVDEVEVRGRPPEHLIVWATLHFLPEGSPFCCEQPGCHLGPLDGVGEHVRRSMRLRQELTVDFGGRIGVQVRPVVSFHYGLTDG